MEQNMELINLLINTTNSKFEFSKEFMQTLNERTSDVIISKRTHPEIIKLFHEKGSQWSSAPTCSLKSIKLPKILQPLINIYKYNGEGEKIEINIQKELCRILQEFMTKKSTFTNILSELDAFEKNYNSLINAYEYFSKNAQCLPPN
jgi:hypothetical protein